MKFWSPDYFDCTRVTRIQCAGQQHQQYRAMGLGQRPFLETPTSFTNHLRESPWSFRRTKHHQHHQPTHQHQHHPQGTTTTATTSTTSSVSNNNSTISNNNNNNNTNSSTTSPSSISAGPVGSSVSAHQEFSFKHSPPHGGKLSIYPFNFLI